MADPSRRSVVLFDFDGTLADTISLIVASFHAILPTPASDAEIRTWIGRPLIDVLEARYPGDGERLTADYRRWNLGHHDELIRPVPGIEQVLDALAERGTRVGVASSKLGPTVQLGLAAVGLGDRVDLVVGQEQTERHKPDPAPLLLAAQRLGVAPADTVYVGDSVVDVQAATAAGMPAIGVTWGAGTRAELSGADAIVDKADELAALL